MTLFSSLSQSSVVSDDVASDLDFDDYDEADDKGYMFAASSEDTPVEHSPDLFASRQPLTQDLVPEVSLREPESSSPSPLVQHVSVVLLLRVNHSLHFLILSVFGRLAIF